MRLESFNDYHKKRVKKNKKAYKDYDKEYEEFEKNYQIGILIKKMRKEAGMTQTELAEKIDSSKNAISRLENHSKDIKFSTLTKIAFALGKKIDLDSLFV